jgi:hypothetical protein
MSSKSTKNHRRNRAAATRAALNGARQSLMPEGAERDGAAATQRRNLQKRLSYSPRSMTSASFQIRFREHRVRRPPGNKSRWPPVSSWQAALASRETGNEWTRCIPQKSGLKIGDRNVSVCRLQKRSTFSAAARADFTHSRLTPKVTSFHRGYTRGCAGGLSDV